MSDAKAIDVAESPATLDISLHISAIAETLVVSAAQIDQPLSRTPDSVTVIPGSEIEAKQQFMLSTVLRSVPGLTIQQNGGPGTVTSVFTRGGESDFTLVMIDGIRANRGGGLDLSQVPLQDVDRVEVIRGPQSALYGSDAIGCVINIITRSGGSPSAQAQLEAGSRDMRRASGATTGEVNGARWQLGANYFEDAGFTGQAANGQTVSNDDAQETQASAAIGWRHATAGSDVQGRFSIRHRARIAGALRIGSRASLRQRRSPFPGPPPRANPAAVVRRVSRVRSASASTWRTRPRPEEPVRRVGRQQPPLARARADRRVGECRARIFGRLRVARRARRQHVHHFGQSQRADADRAGRARHLRRRPMECRRSRHRHRGRSRRAHHSRRAPRRSALTPTRLPEETINSVNPKIAASFRVADDTRLRGSVGRHSFARCAPRSRSPTPG